jgi:hypothetical protein
VRSRSRSWRPAPSNDDIGVFGDGTMPGAEGTLRLQVRAASITLGFACGTDQCTEGYLETTVPFKKGRPR